MAMKTNADLERQPAVSLLEERLKADGLLRQFEDERIPVVEVDSFPDLGRMVALRFIEWVQQNPEGVVSLPTGKTPEYFIRWTHHILENWSAPDVRDLWDTYALAPDPLPNPAAWYPGSPIMFISDPWYERAFTDFSKLRVYLDNIDPL